VIGVVVVAGGVIFVALYVKVIRAKVMPFAQRDTRNQLTKLPPLESSPDENGVGATTWQKGERPNSL